MRVRASIGHLPNLDLAPFSFAVKDIKRHINLFKGFLCRKWYRSIVYILRSKTKMDEFFVLR
jgi:hypothetical protein